MARRPECVQELAKNLRIFDAIFDDKTKSTLSRTASSTTSASLLRPSPKSRDWQLRIGCEPVQSLFEHGQQGLQG
jgi:hypothetical protein